MLKKYLFLLSFLSILSFASVLFPVFATVSCTTQYGGGQTCVSTGQLLVNKKVWDPDSKTFLDNSLHRFAIGQEVAFSIEVKNVGDATLNNITIVDTLPGFLTWIGGDQLVSKIDSLTPGQIATKTIKAKVNTGINTCEVNTAVATADNGMADRDSAQVCLGVTPPPTITPKSGPEHLLLLFPLGSLGYLLKRHSGRVQNRLNLPSIVHV